jgi:hypothetical protein
MTRRVSTLVFLLCLMIGFGIVTQGYNVDGNALYVSPSSVEEYKSVIAAEFQSLNNIRALTKETDERY